MNHLKYTKEIYPSIHPSPPSPNRPRKTQVVLVLLKLSGTNVQALFKEDLQDGWDEEPPSPSNVVFGYTA